MRAAHLIGLTCLVAVLGLGAGCGGGSSTPAPSTPQQKLCADVADWQKQVQDEADKLSSNTTDAKAAETQIVNFLDQTSQATADLLTKVQQDSSSSDSKLTASLVSALQAAQSGLEQAKTAIQAIPDAAAVLQTQLQPLKDAIKQYSQVAVSACESVNQ